MQRIIIWFEIVGEFENINFGFCFEGWNQISIGSGDCIVIVVQGEDGYWYILVCGRCYEIRVYFVYMFVRIMGCWFNYLCWY